MKLLKRIKLFVLSNTNLFETNNNENLSISSIFYEKLIIEKEKINNYFQLDLLISSIIYSLAIMIFLLI